MKTGDILIIAAAILGGAYLMKGKEPEPGGATIPGGFSLNLSGLLSGLQMPAGQTSISLPNLDTVLPQNAIPAITEKVSESAKGLGEAALKDWFNEAQKSFADKTESWFAQKRQELEDAISRVIPRELPKVDIPKVIPQIPTGTTKEPLSLVKKWVNLVTSWQEGPIGDIVVKPLQQVLYPSTRLTPYAKEVLGTARWWDYLFQPGYLSETPPWRQTEEQKTAPQLKDRPTPYRANDKAAASGAEVTQWSEERIKKEFATYPAGLL